jgi:hypothetical protein
MTQTDFNHLLASVDALSPDQMRQLLRELESRVATTVRRPAQTDDRQEASKETTGQRAKRAEVAPAQPGKPLTVAELHQKLLAEGRISRLPNTAADFDDPDDQPVTIQGEPLSETVIRERR